MLRLWKRNAKVTVWRTNVPVDPNEYKSGKLETVGVEITNLKIEFEIQRDQSKHPNTCNIKITNLSKQTRGEFEQLPLTVNLEAGHDGVNRLMYVGDVRFAMSEQKGQDWVTLLELGDGGRIHAHARINRSYRAKTTVKQVLRDALNSIGQSLPKNIENASDLDDPYLSGYSAHGPLRDELTRLLAPYGYNWSFQNGLVQILKDEETNNFEFPINEGTGMIGTPEFGSPPKSKKKPHMKVKMLLYPELTPGSRVRIQSTTLNGLFKINKVRHVGDTHGNDWYTEIEVKQTTG